MKRAARLLLLFSTVLVVPAAAQNAFREIDKGNLLLSVRDRAIGAETFEVSSRGDSLTAGARSYRTMRNAQGEVSIEKQMVWTAGVSDWAMRYYQSNETMGQDKRVRGLVMEPGDTAFTMFQEISGGGGTASRMVAPPGRTFVLDSGLYSHFNLICLYLHGKTFTRRPLNLMTLGPPDSLIEVTVVDQGPETIRWGARPVQARKLELSDGQLVFRMWAHPLNGRMLRLSHDASGLRVEREAPAVKKPAPKPGG